MKICHLDIENAKFNFEVHDDGTVWNSDKNTMLKALVDKRRPTEGSKIKFPLRNDKHIYMYLRELVAANFCDNYKPGMKIVHKDGDIRNCAANNLECYSPMDYILRFVKTDATEWKKVDIGIPLLYEYYISNKGDLFNGTTFETVVPFEDLREQNHGYLRFSIYKSDKKYIHYGAGRLVAKHFLSAPKSDDGTDIVYYKDCNPKNLDYRNLVWGNRLDVISNAYRNNPDRKPIHNYAFDDEEWKPIDFLGKLLYEYEISSFGRVYNKSLKRMITPQRRGNNPNNQSWQCVVIHDINCVGKVYPLHRLVAKAFIPNPCPEKYIHVNHINGNPECNWAINLEWCSPMKNLYHAISTNLQHTSSYSGNVTDEYWRTRTIIAWCFAGDDIEDNEARHKVFNMYNAYINSIEDKVEKFNTYEDFDNRLNSLLSDKDFLTLYKFYHEEYSIIK